MSEIEDKVWSLIVEIGFGLLRTARIDLGELFAARKHAQPGSGYGIVRRALQALARTDLLLQTFRLTTQRRHLLRAALVEGSGTQADHRPIPKSVLNTSLATCIARPEAWKACW